LRRGKKNPETPAALGKKISETTTEMEGDAIGAGDGDWGDKSKRWFVEVRGITHQGK